MHVHERRRSERVWEWERENANLNFVELQRGLNAFRITHAQTLNSTRHSPRLFPSPISKLPRHVYLTSLPSCSVCTEMRSKSTADLYRLRSSCVTHSNSEHTSGWECTQLQSLGLIVLGPTLWDPKAVDKQVGRPATMLFFAGLQCWFLTTGADIGTRCHWE